MMALSCLLAALWLAGYFFAIGPAVWEAIKRKDFSMVYDPYFKIMHFRDPITNTMSGRECDPFSLVDGPTGIEYVDWALPCWPISLGASFVLALGLYSILWTKRNLSANGPSD